MHDQVNQDIRDLTRRDDSADGVLAWCREAGGGLMDHYLAAGGFAGAARACRLGPAGIIAELRAAGLRDWGSGGGPVYLAWLELMQSIGDRVLVVDARESDPRSLLTANLLKQNPYGLVEALFIAALATGAKWVRLLLSPADDYLKPALRSALAEAASHELAPGQRVELSLESDETSSSTGEPSINHRQQTWYQVPLLFSRGPNGSPPRAWAGCPAPA